MEIISFQVVPNAKLCVPISPELMYETWDVFEAHSQTVTNFKSAIVLQITSTINLIFVIKPRIRFNTYVFFFS